LLAGSSEVGDTGLARAMSGGTMPLSEAALAIAQAQTHRLAVGKRNCNWVAFNEKLMRMRNKQKKGYFIGNIDSIAHCAWENKQLTATISAVWFRPQYDLANFPQALVIVVDEKGRNRLGSLEDVIVGQFNADLILACCIDRISLVADFTLATKIKDLHAEQGNFRGPDEKKGDYVWLNCMLHEGEADSQAIITCALQNDATTIMTLTELALDNICQQNPDYRDFRQFFPTEVLWIYATHICEWFIEHLGHWSIEMVRDGTDVLTALEDPERQSSRASTMSFAAPSTTGGSVRSYVMK
jgi:hypothetical protein